MTLQIHHQGKLQCHIKRSCIKNVHTTKGSQFTMVWLMIFCLYDGVRDIHSVETVFQFEFWSCPGLVIPSMILSSMVVGRISQPWDNQYTDNCSIPIQPLFFTFSTVFNNYMRHSTLYYKTGFVSNDFAQL